MNTQDVLILRLYFKFETEFIGSFYVTGNAFRHAIGRKVNTSIGIFSFQKKLSTPETYDDFFQPRIFQVFNEINYHTFFCKRKKRQKQIFYSRPYGVIFDIINPDKDLLEYIKNKNLLQFGGGRNRGYGYVTLKDYIFIDLNTIEMPKEGTHISLLSPMIYIPKFVEPYNCRKDVEIFWNNSRKNAIRIIPKGQFFRIKKGKNIKKIALKGILRKCLFGAFGYGEYMVKNWKNGGK